MDGKGMLIEHPLGLEENHRYINIVAVMRPKASQQWQTLKLSDCLRAYRSVR